MSILYQINITKYAIQFIVRTREITSFSHIVELDGTCQDKKWFDLVYEFLGNGCELEWDKLEPIICKEIKNDEIEKLEKVNKKKEIHNGRIYTRQV